MEVENELFSLVDNDKDVIMKLHFLIDLMIRLLKKRVEMIHFPQVFFSAFLNVVIFNENRMKQVVHRRWHVLEFRFAQNATTNPKLPQYRVLDATQVIALLLGCTERLRGRKLSERALNLLFLSKELYYHSAYMKWKTIWYPY